MIRQHFNIFFQKYYKLSIFAIILGFLYSCSTKKVSEGEYLLTKNKYTYTDKTLFSNSIPNYISQTPNSRNVLGIPMGLWLYNWANPKYDSILNEYMNFPSNMRTQKLRDSLAIKMGHPEFVGKTMIWSRIMHTLGKAPIILDSSKTHTSANAIKRYLGYRGYWDSHVTYNIVLNSKKKKAENHFIITHNTPTYISDYHLLIHDNNIRKIYEQNISKSEIKKGHILDQKKLEDEIKRINEMMREAGYYGFNASNEEVFFTADTLNNRKQVPLFLEIEKDTLGTPYKKHTIGKIEIIIKPNITDSTNITEKIGDVTIKKKNNSFKGKTIWRAITVNRGDIYNQNRLDLTRRNLLALNNFSIVNTNPISKINPNDTILNLSYALIPLQKYDLKLATDIHYSQILNFGISPSIEFTSRNIFHGGENFGASISGILGSTKNENNNFFNAYEFSGELSLKFPRFLLPFSTDKIIPRRYSPSSAISMGVSIQNNIGLGRINFNGGINYYLNVNDVVSHRFSLLNTQLSKTRNKDNYYDIFPNNKHIRDYIFRLYQNINPSLISNFHNKSINSDAVSQVIIRDDNFQNHLNTEDQQRMTLFRQSIINKDRLTQDALIIGWDYNFIYNEIGKKNYKHPFYFNAKFEMAGNALSLLEKVLGPKHIESGIINPLKNSFFKIPYYQFAKVDLDIRKYINFNDGKQSLIFRQFIGLGLPYGKSSSMPFVRSYYNGGSNDIRAWRGFGGLGPGGSLLDENIRTYMMGDMKLTTNVEYRFRMNDMFHGAIFTDMGNTWNISSEAEPESKFQLNKFYKQMGIGSGFGLRINIAYVTFRFDFAYKMYNPNKSEGNRWVISNLKPLDPTVNFAIGYPF